MDMDIDIKVSLDGTVATIAVGGKLTALTSPDLDESISALPSEVTNLVLDMSETEYISSSGLRVLVGTAKMASMRGRGMLIRHPTDEVYEVLDMTGLAEILNVER